MKSYSKLILLLGKCANYFELQFSFFFFVIILDPNFFILFRIGKICSSGNMLNHASLWGYGKVSTLEAFKVVSKEAVSVRPNSCVYFKNTYSCNHKVHWFERYQFLKDDFVDQDFHCYLLYSKVLVCYLSNESEIFITLMFFEISFR